MQSYLSGRGGNADMTRPHKSDFVLILMRPLGSLIEFKSKTEDQMNMDGEVATEVIYEQEGCPKVEVTSLDGKPASITIHLPDGRLFWIANTDFAPF